MKNSIFGILTVFSLTLFAQSDKVFLKNGSTLFGTVSPVSPTDTLKILINGSPILIPMNLVEEIRIPPKPGAKRVHYVNYSYLRGMSTSLDGGFLIGSPTPEAATTLNGSMRISQEVLYKPFLNGGVEAGIASYHSYTLFPVAISYYALPGNRHRSWIIYSSFGYGFAGNKVRGNENLKVQGGTAFQAGIGWQRKAGTNAVRFKLGYSLQTVEERFESWGGYGLITKRQMNRIEARFAYVFRY